MEDGAAGVRRRGALVVGGGPAGLSCALALRARGLPVAVLEAEPRERIRPGSRAIFVHRAAIQTLERIQPGLGRRLAARGVVWRTKRTLWRGREVFARTYPPLPAGAIPPFTSLPQTEIERLLLDACLAAGVEVAWDSAVEHVDVRDCEVLLRTGRGCWWSAPYVVGADGARSAVRRCIGVELEGSRSAHSYVVVDAAADHGDPRPIERVFHYGHPAVGGRNVLLVPFTGGWRLDLQCRTDDDPAAWSGDEPVRRWVGRVLGPGYADRVCWVSTYRFLQVLAKRFRDERGRVLLVGEAAHLFPPFGARGMNSGIEDAEHAAAAIQEALRASEPRQALAAVDRYAVARRRVAEGNRRAAGQALAHMEGRSIAVRARLRLAAAIATAGGRMGAWLDSAPYGPGPGR